MDDEGFVWLTERQPTLRKGGAPAQERSAWTRERSALGHRRSALEQERSTLEHQRSALEEERRALEEERSTLEHQRSALERERSALEKERAEWLLEGRPQTLVVSLPSLRKGLRDIAREAAQIVLGALRRRAPI